MGQVNVIHEKLVLFDEMVGRENGDHGFGVTLQHVHERNENAGASVFVHGLEDSGAARALRNLSPCFGILQMVRVAHHKDSLRTDQPLHTAQGGLEQRALPGEFDVLFGQIISS